MTDNPILESRIIYGDRDPTPPTTCTSRPAPTSAPSAAHRKLVGEIGLRYRPSAQADLPAHAAALALMVNDVADVPVRYLDPAIRRWVREKQWMPKASELIELARDEQARSGRGPRAGDPVETGNAHLAKIGRHDCHWYRDDTGALRLGPAQA